MAEADAVTDWSALVRPSLVGVAPYSPGPSVTELKERYGLSELHKLNWNEGLFGPFTGVLEAVEAELANVWAYPEQAYADLREAVAVWLGTDPAAIVPAHGIQGLVTVVAAAFVERGTPVVIPSPTYGLYAQVCRAAGAEVIPVPLGSDLRINVEAVAAEAARSGARLVWIADPNNPTGAQLTADEWAYALDALPGGCVAVVDEAYREYVDPDLQLRRERDVNAGRSVLLLRTFSKIFGLAGLRLGYAVAGPGLAGFLDVVQEPFNVNRAALAAGRASLARPELIEERRHETRAARELLTDLLREAGAAPFPTQANFVLARLDADDLEVADSVARGGYLIRPGSEFGLPGYARITVGPPTLMEGVAAQLARALG